MEPWYVRLSKELVETKRFAPERTTPRALSSRYHAKRAVSVLTHGERGGSAVAGYAALWKLPGGEWYELELMKCPSDQYAGLLWERLPEIMGLVHPEKRVVIVSDHVPLLMQAASLGFTPVTTSTMPDLLAWASRLHLVQKVPTSVHTRDQPALGDGQKWLLVR